MGVEIREVVQILVEEYLRSDARLQRRFRLGLVRSQILVNEEQRHSVIMLAGATYKRKRQRERARTPLLTRCSSMLSTINRRTSRTNPWGFDLLAIPSQFRSTPRLLCWSSRETTSDLRMAWPNNGQGLLSSYLVGDLERSFSGRCGARESCCTAILSEYLYLKMRSIQSWWFLMCVAKIVYPGFWPLGHTGRYYTIFWGVIGGRVFIEIFVFFCFL